MYITDVVSPTDISYIIQLYSTNLFLSSNVASWTIFIVKNHYNSEIDLNYSICMHKVDED